ncbi:MAG: sigma factor-like helix-turn-helix DNA-binding protein [Bacteroidota bacterium]
MNQFIQELKEIDKALILLYLEELSHKDIANILGISPTNVGTKLSRIKNALRKRFQSTLKNQSR